MMLYEGWRSSASWRVPWALTLKHDSYQSVLVDIEAGEHLTALAGLNPMRTVPILMLDDGRVLTESGPPPGRKPMTRLALTAWMCLSGCSILPEPKPVHYQNLVLDATPGPTAAPPRAAAATVALRGVELPSYLDRDVVVTRTADNEVRYSNDERWAEPLAEAVPRILALDLAPLLAADAVELLPRAGDLADTSVTVSIQRFERGVTGRAELRAGWTLHDRARRTRVGGGEVNLVDEQGGPIAAGLSRLLGRLGEAIAADVRRTRTSDASGGPSSNGR